jgi:hypothetical protein
MLAGASYLHAQASPTATRGGDLQIGGGFTTVIPDYRPQHYNGGTAYVDFDFTHRFGAEANFHYASDPQGTGQYEKSYEIGGRYHRTYGRFVPYAKLLYGRGIYNYTQAYQANPPNGPIVNLPVANLAYNMLVGGAGVDYKLLSRLNIRGDWEYQRWFNFQGSSLSPVLFTIGGAYHFK